MSLKDQLRILVVDDTSVSRALICDGLDQIGMKNVSIARDGEEGLDRDEDEAVASRHFRPQHAQARRARPAARGARI